MGGNTYPELLDGSDPEERKRELRDRALDELVAQAQELGMGYEPGGPHGRGDAPIAINAPPYYTEKSKELPMSTEATLTSKGQTTIPKEIREGLHMKTGDRMTFTLLPDG